MTPLKFTVVLIVVGVVAFCGCLGLFAVVSSLPFVSTPIASRATIPPTATPIPYRGLRDAATLGGTFAGFRATYGGPSGPDSFVFPASVMVVATLQYQVGIDGGSHVAQIDVNPVGQWTQADAQHAITALRPADAIAVRTLQLDKYTIEYIDQSARLAATFPARLFTDVNGKPQPSGTFSYACDVGTSADGCTFSIQV